MRDELNRIEIGSPEPKYKSIFKPLVETSARNNNVLEMKRNTPYRLPKNCSILPMLKKRYDKVPVNKLKKALNRCIAYHATSRKEMGVIAVDSEGKPIQYWRNEDVKNQLKFEKLI